MTLASKFGLSLAGVLFVAAMALLTYYGLSGSYVAENGRLVEEFWALASGLFFLIGSVLIGALTGAISGFRKAIWKRRRT